MQYAADLPRVNFHYNRLTGQVNAGEAVVKAFGSTGLAEGQ